MSRQALIFGEGYRGRKLEVKRVCGSEHAVPGQHDAIWGDDEGTIELSYVSPLSNAFVVVLLDAETLGPRAYMEAGVFGPMEKPVPRWWSLDSRMREAVARLKVAESASTS